MIFLLPVHVEKEPSTSEMSTEVGSILLRSVRELLHNIVKHARAEKVRVSFGVENLLQTMIQVDGAEHAPLHGCQNLNVQGGIQIQSGGKPF